MENFTTTLAALRRFESWQDAGETGDAPDLTGDTVVLVRADGSVAIEETGGVLVSEEDARDIRWRSFLAGVLEEQDPEFCIDCALIGGRCGGHH